MSVPDKLETIIKDRIIRHRERKSLLRENQHGLCKGDSCLTNLIEFYEKINKHVDNGDLVGIICLDFQKASEQQTSH